MKIPLSLACIFVTTSAFAQEAKKDATDSISFTFNSTDTAGMGQYGLHIYDARIGRYMPVDTTKQNPAVNPYRFIATRKKKKHT